MLNLDCYDRGKNWFKLVECKARSQHTVFLGQKKKGPAPGLAKASAASTSPKVLKRHQNILFSLVYEEHSVWHLKFPSSCAHFLLCRRAQVFPCFEALKGVSEGLGLQRHHSRIRFVAGVPPFGLKAPGAQQNMTGACQKSRLRDAIPPLLVWTGSWSSGCRSFAQFWLRKCIDSAD